MGGEAVYWEVPIGGKTLYTPLIILTCIHHTEVKKLIT